MNPLVIFVSFVIAVGAVALLSWKLLFLRNPKRTIPPGKNLVSPADGTIIEVFQYHDSSVELFKGNHRALGYIKTMTEDVARHGYIVSIFMSPLDVHYNRTPLSGDIVSVRHSAGKFLPANTFRSGLINEKTEIVIKNAVIRVKIIQIAGFLAKRIETFVQPNDKVKKGQLVGLINLGSQVTLVLPRSVTLTVSKGQKVTAGETIIAKINH